MSANNDYCDAVVALALQRSRKKTASGTRELLFQVRDQMSSARQISDVLKFASVTQEEINASLGEAKRAIDRGLEQGIRAIPISSSCYPATLRQIADAPPVLYLKGSLDALDRTPGVSVVGTRKATSHGLQIAERIAAFLSESEWVVVSGLALGIDAAAHEGALRFRTPTIAVLAHGLERAQPRANEPLAERILESGGAWVSEHEVGVGAKPNQFVLRNRIQVGLSCASVIVEGQLASGSMTQAEYCLRNRRALFAVLPEKGAKVRTVNELPQMLVNQRGAIPIVSRDDYPALLEEVAKRAAQLKGISTAN